MNGSLIFLVFNLNLVYEKVYGFFNSNQVYELVNILFMLGIQKWPKKWPWPMTENVRSDFSYFDICAVYKNKTGT